MEVLIYFGCFVLGAGSLLGLMLVSRESLLRRLASSARQTKVAQLQLQDTKDRLDYWHALVEDHQENSARYLQLAGDADARARKAIEDAWKDRGDVAPKWPKPICLWDRHSWALPPKQLCEQMRERVLAEAGRWNAETIELRIDFHDHGPPSSPNHSWMEWDSSTRATLDGWGLEGAPEVVIESLERMIQSPRYPYFDNPERAETLPLVGTISLTIRPRPVAPPEPPPKLEVVRVEVPVVEVRRELVEVERHVIVGDDGQTTGAALDELLDAKAELAVELAMARRLGHK